MSRQKNNSRITNKYVKFDIPDKCKHCIDNCSILEALSEYEVHPDPDLVDMYCVSSYKKEKGRIK